MIDRLADADLLIAIALATLIVPGIFLVVLATAAVQRRRGHELSDSMLALLALSGGLSLGTLHLFADEISLSLPLLLAAGVVVLGRWRARRRVQAGWFLLGVGLPLVLVGVLILLTPESLSGSPDLFLGLSVGAGALATLAGLTLVVRGDPAPLPPAMDAPAGQPGSRSMGSIAAAIREPSFVGPFGMPEMAMLIAFIAAWVIVPIVLPPDTNGIVVVALASIVGAVLGTEAYIRGMTTRSRRAFEAFSWLGEWELARAHRVLGGHLPTSSEQAVKWLSANPEGPITLPEQLPVRIEILLFAERIDEARAMLLRLPTGTPWERFEYAALSDLVDWRAGGDGDLAGMRETAAAILPRDGDDRLRAEVTIAVARVRRLMAEGRTTPDEAVKPFLEVRELLGDRANGQVGRALRPRIIPGLILAGIALGIVSAVLSAPF